MMQRMEQEIKDLQSGLGTVVQALNFLVTFLESDYGLKFQFHAYCNSSPYSHNSSVLDAVKQKYGFFGVETAGHAMPFISNSRSYHQNQEQTTQSSPHVGVGPCAVQPQESIIQFHSGEGAGSRHLSTSSSSSDSFMGVSNNATTDLSPHYQTTTVDGNGNHRLYNNQRTAVIADDENIRMFGLGDPSVVKEESHSIDDLMQQSDTDLDVFDKSEFDDEDREDFRTSIDKGPDMSQQSQAIKVKVSSSSKKEKSGRTRKEKVDTDHYKCPHCRRKCPDKEKLELHMAHHKQQFECSECGLWLAGKSVLSRHMRTHTGDRPFACEFCKETFSRQDIVKKHIQRKHKPSLTIIGHDVEGHK